MAHHLYGHFFPFFIAYNCHAAKVIAMLDAELHVVPGSQKLPSFKPSHVNQQVRLHSFCFFQGFVNHGNKNLIILVGQLAKHRQLNKKSFFVSLDSDTNTMLFDFFYHFSVLLSKYGLHYSTGISCFKANLT